MDTITHHGWEPSKGRHYTADVRDSVAVGFGTMTLLSRLWVKMAPCMIRLIFSSTSKSRRDNNSHSPDDVGGMGATTLTQNVHALDATKMSSRKAIRLGAILMIVFSFVAISTKFQPYFA